jgi:hypothetical protein
MSPDFDDLPPLPFELQPISIEEQMRNEEIDDLRSTLAGNINAAAHSVTIAEQALRTLASDRVYDIEYAEGGATDIARHLDIAAFHLRAATRANKDIPS